MNTPRIILALYIIATVIMLVLANYKNNNDMMFLASLMASTLVMAIIVTLFEIYNKVSKN